MTTAAIPQHSRAHAAAAAAIPMSRLVEIELRKMVDTRAGRWLLAGAVSLTAIVLAIILATATSPELRSFEMLLRNGQVPLLAIMPVLGALAATSEWSQRTVLSTFSLVPSRGRVLVAKLGATLVLATVMTIVTVVMSAVAALIAPLVGETTSDWSFGLSDAGELLMNQLLAMVMGVALGTALLNSALAIVLFFLLPMIVGGAAFAFKWETMQLWLDPGTSWDHLSATDPMTGTWWARVGVTALVWIVLPMAIGTWRVLRREVD